VLLVPQQRIQAPWWIPKGQLQRQYHALSARIQQGWQCWQLDLDWRLEPSQTCPLSLSRSVVTFSVLALLAHDSAHCEGEDAPYSFRESSAAPGGGEVAFSTRERPWALLGGTHGDQIVALVNGVSPAFPMVKFVAGVDWTYTNIQTTT